MIDFLKKIKKTNFYYILLRYLLIPIYSFFWQFILNFIPFLISKIYLLTSFKKEYVNLKNNTKILVKDHQEFKDLANEIKKSINKELICKNIEFIQSAEYKNVLKGKNNEAAFNYPFKIDLFDQLDDKIQKRIINFAVSDFMIKTACKYLGVFPIFTRVYVNLNISRKDNRQTASQLWHRDDFGYKNLDLFLAIDNINNENGPLFVIKKKDPLNIFFRPSSEINSNLTGERGKILDKDFNYMLDNGEKSVITLKGESGTALLIDSIRNYHKGGYCLKNYRLTLRLNYLTSDSFFKINKFKKKRSNWIKLININEFSFFKRYLLRDRFRLFETKFYEKHMSKLNHMLSIKK